MRRIVDSARWVLRGRSGTAATIQITLANLLIVAINAGTSIITARALGPLGRGEQAAMILWPQFLAFTVTLGLPSALLYNIKRYPDEETEFFSAAILLGTLMGVAASLAGIIFVPQWLGQYSPEVIRVAQWFMLGTPMSLLGAVLSVALEAKNEFTSANQARYLQPLLTLATLSYLALTQALTPLTAGLAYILPGVPIFLWLSVLSWNIYHPRWHSLSKIYKRLLSFGLRSYGIDLLGSLSKYVDQAIVVGLLNPTALGLYVVVLGLSRTLNVFQSAISQVLFPKAAARPVKEVVSLVGQTTRVSIVFSFSTAVVVIVLGPVLLPLLYGPDFIQAVSVLRILVVEVMVRGTVSLLARGFMALGRPGVVTVLQCIGLGLSVPLMLVLIPAYGLEGAGIALLLSTTIRLILVLLSYPLVLKVHPPNLLLNQKDFYLLQQIFKSKRG